VLLVSVVGVGAFAWISEDGGESFTGPGAVLALLAGIVLAIGPDPRRPARRAAA
jgi:hypothetical protein